jgi:hypothetical protein
MFLGEHHQERKMLRDTLLRMVEALLAATDCVTDSVTFMISSYPELRPRTTFINPESNELKYRLYEGRGLLLLGPNAAAASNEMAVLFRQRIGAVHALCFMDRLGSRMSAATIAAAAARVQPELSMRELGAALMPSPEPDEEAVECSVSRRSYLAHYLTKPETPRLDAFLVSIGLPTADQDRIRDVVLEDNITCVLAVDWPRKFREVLGMYELPVETYFQMASVAVRDIKIANYGVL